MSDPRQDEDRLPWLDTPRAPKPVAAGRRRRSNAAPILALLAVFMTVGLGLVAYLAGRGSAPPAPTPAPAVPTPRRAPVPVPPTIEHAAPPPAAEPVAMPVPAAAPKRLAAVHAHKSRTARAHPRRLRRPHISLATVAGVGRRHPYPPPAPVAAPPPAPAPVRLPVSYWYPTPPPALPGRVIQLGIYANPSQADTAWRSVVAAYPYLARLPKAVRLDRPMTGQPPHYRLQLGARTASDARALCRNLWRIGRGCTVL